ncbi:MULTISPECIES: GNAT family N-acetyltransferase [unclassified Francisella]|uniref:GNAT family N-acetyltransferase n=1 Tax=unclassified Francisella TaxID=2610885 RepID=UPI002E329278|nr:MULTISPECIES: N-acetyltransferase family protein [unclassified Francisella]MED7819004.1 GNAT family N-acetyltransferase [Francisella sp. 19S2-4]MED7829839.1 N-acetyltransferase family protein [Francisella sp. 19S2-10]
MVINSDEKVIIRRVTDKDISAIHNIYSYYVLNSISTFEEEVPSVLEMSRRVDEVINNSLPYLVLEKDNTIIGYAYLTKFSYRSAYRFTVENSIYLNQDNLGKGYGILLAKALIAKARLLNIHSIIAKISTSVSIEFHKRLGFNNVGTLKKVGYKFDKWIDVTLMQLNVK